MSSIRLTFGLALRNLFRQSRRSLAVILTVATGTGAIFLFDGFNAGIMNQYRDNTIRARWGHGQVNTVGYREQVYEKPWEHWMENADTLAQEIGAIPGVQYVFPRTEFYALLSNGSTTLSGRGQGIDGETEAKFFTTLNIESGAVLKGEPDGILLGRGLARALNAKPGDRITVLANTVYGSINGLDFNVVGIFHTGAKEFDDVVFRLPQKATQQLLDTTKVESIALGLEKLDDWNRVAKAVHEKHPELQATPFAVLDKVYYQHAVDWLASQFSIIRLIFLLIVILGIFNTVSTGVLERKQEVGNLRANGESRWDVLSLFLAEGVLLGMAGAVVGIALTLLLNATLLSKGILMPPSPGLTRQYHVFVELQKNGAVLTFALGSLCALFGTLLAAVKVARMPIGDLLRST